MLTYPIDGRLPGSDAGGGSRRYEIDGEPYKNGATVNKTNHRYSPYGTYNETELHYAAHKGKLEAYAFLLKNRGNPDIRNSDGKTAGVILRKTVEDIISGQGNKEFDI